MSIDNQKERHLYIAMYLLNTKECVKSMKLEDVFNVSQAQMTRELNRVRLIFRKYNLLLVSIPHHGIKVEGKEIDKRRCINYIVKKTLNYSISGILKDDIYSNEYEQIKQIIINECDLFGYKLSDLVLENLTSHIFISKCRIQERKIVQIDEAIISNLQNESEFPLAVKIAEKIKTKFMFDYPDSEVYYILAYLSGNKIYETTYDENVDILVNKMIESIKLEHNLDFSDDVFLKDMLTKHIMSLLNRIKYKIELDNPLKEEIKKNMLQAYDIAIGLSKIFSKEYNCELSDDEIAFFALHIRLACRRLLLTKKINVLLVCATGDGLAQILKFEIMNSLNGRLDNITCCGVFELDKIKIDDYDLIFTTVPLKKEYKIPTVFIDNLIEVNKSEDINRLLNNIFDIEKYFKEEMFISELDAKDKEDCLFKIVSHISKVYDIPNNVVDMICEREALSSTDICECVAFPHPIKSISNEPIICIALLKNSIVWNLNKVSIVILFSFPKGFIGRNEEVIKSLVNLVDDKEKQKIILKNRDYKTVIRMLKED